MTNEDRIKAFSMAVGLASFGTFVATRFPNHTPTEKHIASAIPAALFTALSFDDIEGIGIGVAANAAVYMLALFLEHGVSVPKEQAVILAGVLLLAACSLAYQNANNPQPAAPRQQM